MDLRYDNTGRLRNMAYRHTKKLPPIVIVHGHINNLKTENQKSCFEWRRNTEIKRNSAGGNVVTNSMDASLLFKINHYFLVHTLRSFTMNGLPVPSSRSARKHTTVNPLIDVGLFIGTQRACAETERPANSYAFRLLPFFTLSENRKFCSNQKMVVYRMH